MTGFSDLVLAASNTKGGRLADWPASHTEGVTWRWTVEGIVDGAGTAIDFTSATCAAAVITDVDGTTVISVGGTPALTFTGAVGGFTLSATAAATAGLASGATKNKGRACLWFAKITSGTDVVEFWGPGGSPFTIEAAG